MANGQLHNAKSTKQDEFYISSSWKLLSFRLDEDNDTGNRETSETCEGGAF